MLDDAVVALERRNVVCGDVRLIVETREEAVLTYMEAGFRSARFLPLSHGVCAGFASSLAACFAYAPLDDTFRRRCTWSYLCRLPFRGWRKVSSYRE